jgi:hypothetical protein
LNNTVLGGSAANSITNGTRNVAVGSQSLLSLTSGYDNVSMGESNAKSLTTGFSNVAIGNQAMAALTSGVRNTIIGNAAGNQVTGNANTFLGSNAGVNITSGGANIAIGYNTDLAITTANNQLNIANNIFGTGLTGSVTNPAGNIGIGNAAPTSTLYVSGSFSTPIRNSTEGTLLTLTDKDYTLLVRETTAVTVSLPDATTCRGRVYRIQNMSYNTVAFDKFIDVFDGINIPAGTPFLDGYSTSGPYTTISNRITIQSDGTNWVSIGI